MKADMPPAKAPQRPDSKPESSVFSMLDDAEKGKRMKKVGCWAGEYAR